MVGAGANTLNITPVTTVAARKAGLAADGSGSIATDAAITNANTAVAQALGLDNIVTTPVIAVVTSGGVSNPQWSDATAGGKYGAVLAALSGTDKNNANNSQTTIDNLAAEITVTGATGTLTAAGQGAVLLGANTSGVANLPVVIAALQGGSVTASANPTPAELSVMSPAQIALLTPAQLAVCDLSAISPAGIAAISASNLAGLGVLQLGSLNTTQLQSLGRDQVVALEAAGKLAALADIAALGETVTSLSSTALGSLDAGQLAGLSQGQISSIAAAGKLAAITDFASLGTDIVALTPAQLATLTNAQLGALNAAQITALGDDGKLSALAVDLLANPVINQIGALGDDIAGLSAAALATFSTTQLDGLSASQIGLLASATPSALTNLSVTQIAALGTDITGLSAGQVHSLSPAQLGAITSAQADALALAGKFLELTATDVANLSGAAIDAVPTSVLTLLSAPQVNALSDTQLLGLTAAQITALANAGRLSALSAEKIAAIGTDVTGLTAAQLAVLGDAQLGGLTKSQIGALAGAGDLTALVGSKLVAVGADIAGLTAAQTAALTNPQLADLDAAQIGSLATDGDLANLVPAQITVLGSDITGLSAAQVNALTQAQLGGIDSSQAAALAAAGDLDSLSAVSMLALSATAIDSVPANVLAGIGAANIAALSLAQVQALTAPQLTALNTAGLLDNLGHPLTQVQIQGLGYTDMDSAEKVALFNSAVHSAGGTSALSLSDIAGGVQAVLTAVGAGTGTVTVPNLQALGLSGANTGNLAAIQAALDGINSASLVDSINELRALVVNASGEMGNGVLNAAELADGTQIAVALPATLSSPAGASVVLHIPLSGAGAAQAITYNLTQADIDRGYALVSVTQAQALASGDGVKAATFDLVVGGANLLTGVSCGAAINLQLAAPVLTSTTVSDGGTQRLTGDLTMTFDESVTQGTGGTITLYRSSDDSVVESFSVATSTAVTGWGSNILTINPTNSLQAGLAYYFKVSAGAIADSFGNAYAGISDATSWNFTGSALSVNFNAVAADNNINIAENTAGGGLTIGGTLQSDTAGLLADLTTGSFAVTLTPASGAPVNVAVNSYNTTNGDWSGTVPAGTLVHGSYTLSVTVTGSSGLATGSVANNSASITVDTSAPVHTATTFTASRNGQALASGAALKAGDVVTVTTTYDDVVSGTLTTAPTLTIGAETGIVLTAGVTSGNTRSWTYTVSASGTADTGGIAVVGSLTNGLLDAAGNPASGTPTASGSYNADTTAPVLTLGTLANALEKMTAAEAASFTQAYTATDAGGSGVASTTAVVKNSGGVVQSGVSLTTTGGNISGNLASLASGAYTIEVTTTDRAGNTHVQSQGVTLDKDAPTLASSTPADNATAINANADLTLTFGDGTQTGMTFGSGHITLVCTTDASRTLVIDVANHGGQLSWSGNVLTINPASPLAAGAGYAVQIGANAITDAAGNPYAGIANSTTLNFTTQTLAEMYQAAGAGTGQTGQAVVDYTAAMDAAMVRKDTVSNDGSANGSNAMAQYINRVTGSDIVSDQEYEAGFSITGHTTAGQAANIKFFLDNDRTTGGNEVGTQLQDGVNGVHIVYNNASGDYTISFDALSTALLQATTHNTYGAGIHQLTVDTDGNGVKDTGEASRLFLVADGTAGATSYDKAGNAVTNGTVAANFTVMDKITKQVFVYYYGDVDGDGVGLWTQMDSGDTAANQGLNTTSRDKGGYNGTSDWDYYNSDPSGNATPTGTNTTAQNTALGYVTNSAAQTWEFSIGTTGTTANWSSANTTAANHTTMNSNTSRLANLDELLALYAANFSNTTTVGAIEPVTESSSYASAVNNQPGGWGGLWSSAPTPSGHAYVLFNVGGVYDTPDSYARYVAAVL